MSQKNDYVAVEKGILRLALNMLSRGTPSQQETAELIKKSARDIITVNDLEYIDNQDKIEVTIDDAIEVPVTRTVKMRFGKPKSMEFK